MMLVMMMVVMMMMVMMASLQALLYQQDDETVFTVEYDIAKQVRGSHDTFDTFVTFDIMIMITNFTILIISV